MTNNYVKRGHVGCSLTQIASIKYVGVFFKDTAGTRGGGAVQPHKIARGLKFRI